MKGQRNGDGAESRHVCISEGEAESRHVRISQRLLESICPSRENLTLYRPVKADDPEVQELAKSIRVFGVKTPLTISLDGYLLSGHRRLLAAKLAGLETVPVYVDPITHDHPDFVRLLVEYNRQRTKSFAEVLREEVVAADPEKAHARLLRQREEASRVKVKTIEIKGVKCRARISKAKMPMLEAAQAVLEAQKRFLPLTDRQIHYALLNRPPLRHASKPQSTYANDVHSYKDLCDLLTRARLEDRIDFDAIHDPTRPVETWDFYASPAPFIRGELAVMFDNYRRDLQQSQPNHIEIIGEKNTIDRLIRPIAGEYGIPMTIGRGYSSLPPRQEMAERFLASGKEKLVLLVLSDLDPEGDDIGHSFARSMRDDFGIGDIVPIKVALTREQVRDLNLPPLMKAKQGSSRRKGFVDRHGSDNVYELEAVPPATLQQILRDAIRSVLDMDAYNREVEAEKADAAELSRLRRQVRHALVGIVDEADLEELEDEEE